MMDATTILTCSDTKGTVMLILRLPEVKRVLGHRADASVYNAIREGLFTNGVAIGQRAKGWPDYEAQSIAAARVAGKSDEEIRELVKVLHTKRNELPILKLADEWRDLK